jgi:hypothetical protein
MSENPALFQVKLSLYHEEHHIGVLTELGKMDGNIKQGPEDGA